eukprot:TRINITY_DN25044_c0_g1_i1.p1 TRINITY_DN25044_c0_g1~~TRINITY_DN25044_c0_g1_i1.p1  ORF type:complete len:155 (-),score=15.57 TRINITY_DN25044_c0_g1_i1:1-465(-)
MNDVATNGKLEKVCREAQAKLQKLDAEKNNDITSKLEWCIGSYNNDKNPEGLIEVGAQALTILKSYKKKNSRQVSKKLIEDLEKVTAVQVLVGQFYLTSQANYQEKFLQKTESSRFNLISFTLEQNIPSPFRQVKKNQKTPEPSGVLKIGRAHV